MFSRILVPTDFSAGSTLAWSLAQRRRPSCVPARPSTRWPRDSSSGRRTVVRSAAGCTPSCGSDRRPVRSSTHGNLHRLLIGSVADRVIRMAPCPVARVRTT